MESRLHSFHLVERFGRSAYLLKIVLLFLLCAKTSLLLPPTLHANEDKRHPCRLDLVSKALSRETQSFLDHPLHNAEALTAAEDSVVRRLIRRAEKIQNTSARYLLIEDLVSDARKHLYSIYQEDLDRKRAPSKSNAYINLLATKTVHRISLHRIELEQYVPQLYQTVKKIAASKVREVALATLPDLVERLFEKTKNDDRSEEDRYGILQSLSSEIFELLHAASKAEAERLREQNLDQSAMDQSRIIKFVSMRILPKLTGEALSSTPAFLDGSRLHRAIFNKLFYSSPRQSLAEAVTQVFEIDLSALAKKKGLALESEADLNSFLKEYLDPAIPQITKMIREYDLAHPQAFEDKKEYEELKRVSRSALLFQVERSEQQKMMEQAQKSPGSLALDENRELFDSITKIIFEGIQRRTEFMTSPKREQIRQQLQLEALQRLQSFDLPPEPVSQIEQSAIKVGKIAREILTALDLTADEIKFAVLRIHEHPKILEHVQLAVSPQRRAVLDENFPKLVAEILERSSYHHPEAQSQKEAEAFYFDNLLSSHPASDTSVLRYAVTKTLELKNSEEFSKFDSQERFIEFREATLPALIERTRFERSIYEGWYGIFAYALSHEKVFLNEIIEGQSIVKKKIRYDLQKKADELGVSPQEVLDRYMPLLNRMFTEALDAQLGAGQTYANQEARDQAQKKIIAFVRAHPLYQQLLGIQAESLPAQASPKQSPKSNTRVDTLDLRSGHEQKKEKADLNQYLRGLKKIELLNPQQERALFTRLEELESQLFSLALEQQLKVNPQTEEAIEFKSRGARSHLILKTNWTDVFEFNPPQKPKLEPLVNEYRRLYNHTVQSNLRLAASIAYKQRYPGAQVDDLIQVANLGLMKAASYFEVSKGFKFSTYAYSVIKRYISRNKDLSGRTFSLTEDQFGPYMQIREAEFNLMQQGVYRPSEVEIASESGLDVALVRRILNRVKLDLSLDAPVGDKEDGTSLSALLADEKSANNKTVSVAHRDMQRQILELLEKMNDAQLKDILIRRNGLDGAPPATLQEIGRSYGLAKERTRRLEMVAERQLRVLLIMSVERFTPHEKEFIQTHYLSRSQELDLAQTARTLKIDPAIAQTLLESIEKRFKNIGLDLFKE